MAGLELSHLWLSVAFLSLTLSLYLAPCLRETSAVFQPGDIWRNCSVAGAGAEIVSVNIYPDPPKKGWALSIAAELNLKENITNGSVKMQLKYGILPLMDKTWPLCEFAKLQHRHCPLSRGPFKFHYNTTVPKDLPAGHITGQGLAVDQNGAQLVCVEVDFHM